MKVNNNVIYNIGDKDLDHVPYRECGYRDVYKLNKELKDGNNVILKDTLFFRRCDTEYQVIESLKKMDLYMARECSPYGDDMLYIFRIEEENKYILVHCQYGSEEILLECKGKTMFAYEACNTTFIDHYNHIKHTFYPHMPYPEDKLEEYKEHNLKVYEDIEKKYEYITDKKSNLDNRIRDYNKAVEEGIAK